MTRKPELAAPLIERVNERLKKDPLWLKGYQAAEPVLDEEEMRNLQSLGYLQAGTTLTRLEPLKASLDPKDGLEVLRLVNEAYSAFEAGNFHDARIKMLHVLKRNPDNPWALGRAGKMLLDSGFPGDAAAFFQRAVQIYPASTEIDYTWLAQALNRTGKNREALEAVETALKLNPTFLPALGLKAHLLFLSGRRDALRLWVNKHVTSDTDNVYLLYYAGGMAMEEKDYSKARSFFHRILSIDEHHASSLDQLASIAFEEGNDRVAERYLTRAIQLDETNFYYRVRLAGLLHTRLNEPRRALQLYRQALPLAPGPSDAARVAQLIRKLEGNPAP